MKLLVGIICLAQLILSVAGDACPSNGPGGSGCVVDGNPSSEVEYKRSLPTTSASAGFVTTSGQQFALNGVKYSPVGSNSHLLGLTDMDMYTAFSDIAATGATTVRTWGFNEVTSVSGIYYQIWSGSTPTVNTGLTGLEHFDKLVSFADARGLWLIVVLTNNWSDYGGMDVYVNQILGPGSPHDYFYTNSEVIAAYKNYIKTFVGRYANNPAILGWDLANEPRCSGSTSATSGTCTTETIADWASEMSAYIRSIDSNHLVWINGEVAPGIEDEKKIPRRV